MSEARERKVADTGEQSAVTAEDAAAAEVALGKEPAPASLSLSSPLRAEGWDVPDDDLKKYRSRWRATVRRILQRVLFRPVLRATITPTVQVARRVKTVRGPFLLVANHTSHLDGPMVTLGLPKAQARYLGTGVAADYFFTKWHRRIFVRWIFNAFPIDRDGSKRHAGTSRRLLSAGVPILVFPEATRQKTGTLGEFKPGAAALAIGVGVPVIPAAIIGAFEAMPKGRSWPRRGRPPVGVFFGDPLVAEPGESAVAFTARIRQAVSDLYHDHHDEILGPQAQDEGGTS